MFLSIITAFVLALGAAIVVPGWEFGGHFFPITFLIALLLAWGVEGNILLSGIFCAFMFEIFLGLHLGVLPLAFLSIVIAYGLLQRPVDLKPLVRDGWNIPGAILCLVIGMGLWILGIAVSWGVLELVYSTQQPFATIVDIFKDISFVVRAGAEIALFLALMALTYRRKKTYGTLS